MWMEMFRNKSMKGSTQNSPARIVPFGGLLEEGQVISRHGRNIKL